MVLKSWSNERLKEKDTPLPFFSLKKKILICGICQRQRLPLLSRDKILILLFLLLLTCTFHDPPISQSCWDQQCFLIHLKNLWSCWLGEEEFWGFFVHSRFWARLWTNAFYGLDVAALQMRRSSLSLSTSPSLIFSFHQQMFLKNT